MGFSSPSYALDNPEQKLTEVIENYVISKHPEWRDLDIQITFKYAERTFADLRKLRGDVGFEVLEVYKDFKPVGNVIFPIQVSSSDRAEKIFVRAKIEVFKNIVVAKHYIPRGEVVKAEDLKLEKRDIAMLPEKYFDKIEYAAETETKTSIPDNSTLFSWMIKEIPQVHRGDKVVIRVVAPNLLLKTEGMALEDGYIGREMKVKREGVKDPIEGILISSNVVEVRIR